MSENIVGTLAGTLVDSTKLLTKITGKFLYRIIDPWLPAPENNYNLEEYFEKISFYRDVEGKKVRPKQVAKYSTILGRAYKFTVPPGISLKDFTKEIDGLSLYIGKKIKINELGTYIEIEVIENELPEKINYRLPEKLKDSIYIPFAYSLNGDLYLDLKKTPHTLCTGATGGGKSVTTRGVITSLINLYPDTVDLFLIDFKYVELSIFKNLKQTKCYITEVADAKEIINDLMEECKDRYRLFEEQKVNNIYDYNKKVDKSKRLKFQFIVIEEFVMLTEDKKKVAMGLLKRFSCMARASGQYLYITGQRFDNTVIDIVLRSQIGNRLCHKVESLNDSRLIIDTIGADKLRGNGHMLAKINGSVIEAQSYFISDDIVRKYISKYIENTSTVKKETTTKQNKKINIEDKKEVELNILTDMSFLDNI